MASTKSIKDAQVKSILSIGPNDKTFYKSPIAWEDQILYFLLPDRFSNDSETGYLDLAGKPVSTGTTKLYQNADNGNALDGHMDDNVPGNTQDWLDAGSKFVGGTIRGLTSKLGYLKRLGITAIWVGPLFKQVAKEETYHGYGVQDFLDVDPRFGTREDLQEFVKKAHDEGIYVLLDIILNHSGDVFQYVANGPIYDGSTFDVAGYYDSDRNPSIPLSNVPIDETRYPNAFPDAAIWPSELQPMHTFTRKGRIGDNSGHWDTKPEYLDGDFYSLKDLSIGPDSPDNFTPTPALLTLCAIYKYWLAYLDLDGYRIDTVKHMGDGPTRYFASTIHEFATILGKENFLLIGEITGAYTYETLETTGLDAALGIGGVQESLWKLPKGLTNPSYFFDQFRNALYLKKGSHTWFRNRVVTMIDDHDQVWRSGGKGRFCSEGNGSRLMLAGLALNLCTLGIPCVYYGSEQYFDGSGGDDQKGHAADQYIREAMFGGGFGAFRSNQRHFFDEDTTVFKELGRVAEVRRMEIALRRGRQYLREISGDGVGFGFPMLLGDRMKSVVAWSRIFGEVEILCAINTDAENKTHVWVTVDNGIHPVGATLECLYPSGGAALNVEGRSDGRAVVQLVVPAGGFAIYK
jgi:glycosidase